VNEGGLSALIENVVHERRRTRVLESPLVAPRAGVMLHYDDSSRDEWALEWFSNPQCRNGYTWLVMDSGRVVELANPLKRTPHAGPCRTANANSAFYGIAAATNGLVPATTAQVESIVRLVVLLARLHRWAEPMIVGHDAEAIWTPATTRAAGIADHRGQKLWGNGGRKVDPTGVRADGVPVVDVADVRKRVAAGLAAVTVSERGGAACAPR